MSNVCSICLIDAIVQSNKCTTQCNHNFCKNCLDTWFDRGKATCPMCRQNIQYFTYNGLSTRIISVEKTPVVRQGAPSNIPVVTVTKLFYDTMKYFNIVTVSANIISLYVITQYCDL